MAAGQTVSDTTAVAAASDSLSVATLTLEECRQMALDGSTSAQIDAEQIAAAEELRKAALAAMFPRLDANMAYSYTNGNFHLLSNQAEFSFGTATAYDGIGDSHFEWADATTDLSNLESQAGQMIADLYQELYDRLTLDVKHTFVAQVGIVQPIYVGGRLREMYNISKSAERVAGLRQDANRDELILRVDEAYWRVISVDQKRLLAQDYFDLLKQLEQDVETAVAAGLATQSDLLSVRVKRAEAETQLMQATNGLLLSEMALCQVCGLPLTTPLMLNADRLGEPQLHPTDTDIEAAVDGRKELVLLDEAVKVAESGVRLAAAGLQPNIVASANYIYSNPNIEDGLSNNWRGRGFFTAGVVVNIPIAHAEDILRVRAAKHTARVAQLHRDDARQLLVLQTTQAQQKVLEADRRLEMATAAIDNAEENLRYAKEMFAAGMVTASDVMQVQTAWLKAHSDLIDAQVDAMMADTYLRKYTGELR